MAEMQDKSQLINDCPDLMHLVNRQRMRIAINPAHVRSIEEDQNGARLATSSHYPMGECTVVVSENYQDVIREFQRAKRGHVELF